jgi:hypothetical protein
MNEKITMVFITVQQSDEPGEVYQDRMNVSILSLQNGDKKATNFNFYPTASSNGRMTTIISYQIHKS